jgi:hypothetical protein
MQGSTQPTLQSADLKRQYNSSISNAVFALAVRQTIQGSVQPLLHQARATTSRSSSTELTCKDSTKQQVHWLSDRILTVIQGSAHPLLL